MSFDALRNKVEQAEQALEASERSAAADWRQFGASWRQAWTPGRIVIAGLASGALFGTSRTLQDAGSSGGLKLLLGISSLLTAKSAESSAEVARSAVQSAEATAEVAREAMDEVVGEMPTRPLNVADAPHETRRAGRSPDDFRRRGSL